MGLKSDTYDTKQRGTFPKQVPIKMGKETKTM